tara:strand:+ start:194 stop:532 length:339 start_codon:yes stop_codon:yes gene_type:complete
MKVYISGMITSLKEEQYRKAFNKAANHLTKLGHEPVDPSLLGKPEHHAWDYYMRKAIVQLVECDAIYMLSSYNVSKGALLEKKIAEALGMTVWIEQTVNEDLDTGNYGQEEI